MDLLTVLFIITTGIAIIIWTFIIIFKPNEYDPIIKQKLKEKKQQSLSKALNIKT